MRHSILIILFFLIPEFCFSQTDFRKGYVITNVRDTLFGLVDYREGFNSYKSCDFKEGKNQTAITYGPGSLIGYGFVNDRIYESKELTLTDQQPQTVFIEVLIKGIVSLYKFESTYWIKKDSEKLYQLINEKKETYLDDKLVLKYSNQHIGILNMLMFDCAELKPAIQKVTLSEKILTSLVEDYNRCRGESGVVYKEKKPWTKALIGMTGGINISKLEFTSDLGRYDHLTGSFETSKSPTIGISLDILFPRISESISFHSDFLYLTSRYYYYSVFDNNSAVLRNYVTIELQQMKVPIGFRYTFPERKVTPYINFGLSGTIHLNSSSTWIQEAESNNVVETFTTEALSIKKNQFGLWGGVGALMSIGKKLTVFSELRFERTDGISVVPQAELNSKIRNFQVIIGIRTK
jgi:hypothetical protein